MRYVRQRTDPISGRVLGPSDQRARQLSAFAETS